MVMLLPLYPNSHLISQWSSQFTFDAGSGGSGGSGGGSGFFQGDDGCGFLGHYGLISLSISGMAIPRYCFNLK